MAEAALADRFDVGRRCQRKGGHSSVPKDRSLKKKTLTPAKPKSEGTGGSPKSNPPRVRCFNCQALGHFSRNCPQKRVQEGDRGGNPVVGTVGTDLQRLQETITQLDATAPSFEQIEGRAGMRRVDICCGTKTINVVIDSGAEISVVREGVVPETDGSSGKVVLTGAFGNSVSAVLKLDPVALPAHYVEYAPREVPLLCAVTDRLVAGVDMLLTPDDYESLRANRGTTEAGHGYQRTGDALHNEDDETSLSSDVAAAVGAIVGVENVDGLALGPLLPPLSSPRFRSSQISDETLKSSWEQAGSSTHGMFVKDGLLFHREEVNGKLVKQLVLSLEKRPKVLEMGHGSMRAGHLRERKTKARVMMSFYWPGMAGDIKRYCQSCEACQLRSPITAADRVPIAPLARPEVPFQTVFMDCIGPLEPQSARGHRYALCIVDACTRWPEVVCLKSLTAKSACDARVEVFSRMGVPETICSDQGSNFTAQVTTLLLEKMGATPRFSAPDHTQSNGLVERWNGTFKKMLHHVIHERGREWDKHVPFLLWAYREVPNETTGVTPFELMYGREPVGPLAILSKTWTGEWTAPCGLTSSAEDYLVALRQRFAAAADAAREHSSAAKSSYAGYCNRNARPKAFQGGDVVLVLGPDSTNALLGRGRGPAVVVEQRRPCSYLVQFGDGSQRVLHASKLRPYHERVCTVGVIFEGDEEFGDIPDVPLEPRPASQPSDLAGACEHLGGSQRRQLEHLLRLSRACSVPR
ncbi:uncharacterized protein LOC120842535 [Ixodes scapularis]|uniref:uncharacterized protein LOC120842535 n=1 Tax=Ixodes scapularis TaxID=6945 RepID=UPI001A9E7A46|nr:uncharacterized protein LOC120842535 [Ixodes scapularis]